MKKEYIEPSVKAVEIKLNHLMVLSDPTTGTKVDPNAEEITNPDDMDGFHADFEDAF
ncbi:MAG: hypothetical protein IKO28_06165 [Prevotella sp.]|nr:hypothetical protein [Prevotella sp.]